MVLNVRHVKIGTFSAFEHTVHLKEVFLQAELYNFVCVKHIMFMRLIRKLVCAEYMICGVTVALFVVVYSSITK